MGEYSTIRHISRGVLFSNYRSAAIVILSAYLDTSGTRRSESMTMAGMLSTVTRWDRFQEEWPIFLARHKVSSLHMTDFVSSKGEFRGWAGRENSERRKRFIEKAVVCVKKHARRGFVSTLPLSDFNEANAQYQVEEKMGAPLTICGMGIMRQLALWALDHKFDPRKISTRLAALA
jgi:hypothetical protein